MAREATIDITVLSSDAEGKIEQLEQSVNGLGTAALQSEDRHERLFNTIEAAASDSASGVESAVSRSKQALRSQEIALQQTADAGSTLSTSTSSAASNLSFELTQAAQDAQFGLAGVANQVPIIAEQFQQLKARTGSTTGAISALSSSFLGPAGLIAAITLLPTLIQGAVSFFSSVEGEAKDAASEVDKLKEATNSLIEGFRDELPEFDIVGDPERVEQTAEALQTQADSLERQVSLAREALGAEGAQQAQLSEQAAELATRFTDQELRERIQAAEQELQVKRAVGQVLSQNANERQRSVRAQRLLNRLSVTQVGGDGPSLPSAPTGQRPTAGLIQVADTEVTGTPGLAGGLGRRQRLQARAANLTSVSTAQQGLSGRASFQTGIQNAREYTRVLRQLGRVAVNVGPKLRRAIGTAVQGITRALVTGQNPLRAFAQTLGSLMQRIGAAVIAQAKALSAVFSGNPALALPAGAALIAAGTALKNLLGKGRSRFGGGAGGVRRGAGRGVPGVAGGGARATTGVSAPGRRAPATGSGDGRQVIEVNLRGGDAATRTLLGLLQEEGAKLNEVSATA